MLQLMISIINHRLLGAIRTVISTLTCTSMASTSTSNSECCLAVQAHDCKNTVAAGVPIIVKAGSQSDTRPCIALIRETHKFIT